MLTVLIVQMLPAEGMFIAQSQMMSNLGLKNNILGLSLLYMAAVVPFTVLDASRFRSRCTYRT